MARRRGQTYSMHKGRLITLISSTRKRIWIWFKLHLKDYFNSFKMIGHTRNLTKKWGSYGRFTIRCASCSGSERSLQIGAGRSSRWSDRSTTARTTKLKAENLERSLRCLERSLRTTAGRNLTIWASFNEFFFVGYKYPFVIELNNKLHFQIFFLL